MRELKSQADRLYAERNFAGAIALYKKILQEDKTVPFGQSLMYNLGMCYQGERMFPEALETFEAFLEKYPEHQRAQEQLSGLFAQMSREEQFSILSSCIAQESFS